MPAAERTRMITWGAVLCALSVLMIVISTYTPVGKRVLFLATALPIIFFAGFDGLRGAGLVTAATFLLALIINPLRALLYLAVPALLAFIYLLVCAIAEGKPGKSGKDISGEVFDNGAEQDNAFNINRSTIKLKKIVLLVIAGAAVGLAEATAAVSFAGQLLDIDLVKIFADLMSGLGLGGLADNSIILIYFAMAVAYAVFLVFLLWADREMTRFVYNSPYFDFLRR